MKLVSIILPGLLVLAGCTTQPDAPKTTKNRHGESGIGVLRTKGRYAGCGADSARRKVRLQTTRRGSD